MDNTRRLIRWAIPGGLLLFCVSLSVLAAQKLPTTRNRPAEDIWPAVTGLSAAGVAGLAAAALLIGFLLNHAYYAMYKPSYFGGRAVTFDRGNAVLVGLPSTPGLPPFPTARSPYEPGWLFTELPGGGPEVLESHIESWHGSWHRVRGLLTMSATMTGKNTSALLLKGRMTYFTAWDLLDWGLHSRSLCILLWSDFSLSRRRWT